jgi:hypothetical protein
MKRKNEALTKHKSDQDAQVKSLLNNFLTQRKALELSIAKNKRLEEELNQERTKNSEVSEIKK